MSLDKARKEKRTKIKKRYIFRITTFIVLIILIIYALVINLTEDNDTYQIGDQAPNFELTQLNPYNDQEIIELSDIEEKGLVLNFWASYCQPCEHQLSFMSNLYERYKDEIEIVAVNLDNSEIVIDQFIHKYELMFPVVHDARSEVMNLYDVSPIPRTIFISPEGEMVDKVEGVLTSEELNEYFQEILPKSH